MDPLCPVYTIGHSTRSILQFVELLHVGKVDTVVDIRSTPRSSTNPQFNFDALPQALTPWHMGYTQIMELGGRRRKSTSIAPAVNAFWMHQSFHNYADHALSDEFHSGLTRLLELSAVRRCAIMCSESLWWRCHRRIVADYLLHNGRTVFHLMSPARLVPAWLTEAATAQGASLVYPATTISSRPG